jgi:signal transduction histidine kinase
LKDFNYLPVLIPLLVVAGGALGYLAARLRFNYSPRFSADRLQAAQLRACCAAIRKAASTLVLAEILDTSARIIVDVTGVRGCCIRLKDAKTGKMEVKALVGIESDAVANAVNVTENLYQQGLMAGEPIVVRDLALRDFPEIDEEVESLICVPLRLEEKIMGAICVYGERGQKLTQEMISILASLGDVVSLTIAHAYVYEELKSLVNIKTRFMMQTSHELCSPLNTIQSIARTFLRGYLGEISESQREMLARIDTRAQLLTEVVSDLLTLAKSRVKLPSVQLVGVDVNKLLLESVGFFEAKFNEKKIDLQLECLDHPVPVTGSEEGLRSVITNLVSNAVKYTPAGGRVSLRLLEKQGGVFSRYRTPASVFPARSRSGCSASSTVPATRVKWRRPARDWAWPLSRRMSSSSGAGSGSRARKTGAPPSRSISGRSSGWIPESDKKCRVY